MVTTAPTATSAAPHGDAALRTKHPIHGSSRASPAGVWVMALAWNALMAAFFIAWGLGPIAGILMFSSGIWTIWAAIRYTLRRRRYRNIMLDLDPFPAVPGGELAGSVMIPAVRDTGEGFKLALKATEYTAARGFGGRIHVMRQLRFEQHGTADATAEAEGTRIRFRMRLPAEAPPSVGYGETIRFNSNTANRVLLQWTLRLTGKMADVSEEFEIPVAPAAGIAAAAPATALDTEPGPAVQQSFRVAREGAYLRVSQLPWEKDGETHSTTRSVLVVFVGVLSVAFGLVLLAWGNWFWAALAILFGVVEGGYFFLKAAHLFEAQVDADGIRIRRSLWGMRVQDLLLARERIAAVAVQAESASHGSGHMEKIRRSVAVRTADGRLHVLVEDIGRDEALVLRDLIASQLGLGAEASAGSVDVARTDAPKPVVAPRWLVWVVMGLFAATVAYVFGYPFVRTLLRAYGVQ